MTYFVDHDISLRPVELPNTGFRPGQLGALHSLLAHFSVHDEPALVSLPTGYGKTAVMMAAPFLLRARRVLIVAPTDALRRQTASHFKELSTLRKLNVLGSDVPLPRVLSQTGKPRTAADWSTFENYDVIVSTPQSVSPTGASLPPEALYDLILFDEAHHVPAASWSEILTHHKGARAVFLTATPFRRDRKTIPGRIAYWYPVLRAARENAFGRVSFRAAAVGNDRDDNEVDHAVAGAAVQQLAEDRRNGFDHRIFARAASINAAKALVEVYSALGARVRAIHSHASKRTQDEIEAALLDGTLDGVVCVDMFGEGYDFPKLKIAALHAPHRSLVPTLQFIGRFARTTDASTGDATLVAATSKLRDASIRLFKEGIDISELIDEAARGQIAEAEADREVLEILKPVRTLDSDYDAVSPLLLELYAHAQIYEMERVPDFASIGEFIARKLEVMKQWTSDDGHITMLLTLDYSPPAWATSDAITNIRHDAFLMAYNPATRLCFIGSTRRQDRIYLDLIQTVCADGHRPISYEHTRQALAGLSGLRFYNVGLRNTAVNSQAESYRTLTGPSAERAITPGDARSFAQGHIFGSGIGSDDERETIGASSSSKIWSTKRLTVAEYLAWATVLNARLNGNAEIERSQLDLIQHARTLRQLPDAIIAAAWPKQAFKAAPRIQYRPSPGAQLHFASITDLEIQNCIVDAARTAFTFDVVADHGTAQFEYSLTGGNLFQHRSGLNIDVLSAEDESIDLAQWLCLHSPTFFAANKSSFSGINLLPAASPTTRALGEGDAIAIDWAGCDTTLEFGAPRQGHGLSIHDWLERYLLSTPGLEILLYDHRTGEAADFVAVTCQEGNLIVGLYHCKGAGGAPSGGRVSDVYEVSGQMLKSVAYCDTSILLAHTESRINPGRHRNPSRFVRGTLEQMRALLDGALPTQIHFEIYGVQPGISVAAVDNHLSALMIYGLEYVKRGGAARSSWLVSP